jgi:hypothetical protein
MLRRVRPPASGGEYVGKSAAAVGAISGNSRIGRGGSCRSLFHLIRICELRAPEASPDRARASGTSAPTRDGLHCASSRARNQDGVTAAPRVPARGPAAPPPALIAGCDGWKLPFAVCEGVALREAVAELENGRSP